jgi:hypothetical protein
MTAPGRDDVRQRMADSAAEIARLAQATAEMFENSPRLDERRARFAQWEREVAAVERRNAARLRAGQSHGLEPLPPKPDGV